MIRKAFIIITALLGITFIALFAWVKKPVENRRLNTAEPRCGTIQLDTSALGRITYFSGGIIAGNDHGELRIFPALKADSSPRIIPLAKSQILAAVLVKDGVCYVGDDDGFFYAYDLKKGLKWKYKTGNKIVASARWCNGLIIVGSYDQYLYAFEPDGKLRYKIECGSYINDAPVYSASDHMVYFGSCDGILRKAALSSGRVTGQIDLESPIPSRPVMSDDILYAVTHDNGIAAVRTEPFAVLYHAKLFGSYVSAPYVDGNRIFLTDSNGRLTVHSRADGKLQSTLESQEPMTPLAAGTGRCFYAVSTRGKLYQYENSNQKWSRKLLKDFQTDCRQSCRLCGKTLVVADESGGLYFYEVSP
ncbi:MAG: PQQ-binding-like beta-propeller repeat protein [Victivallales bacterium]|nr:PQQ-binding-like beta-propeller repeat protein [Victivallales bacterium]